MAHGSTPHHSVHARVLAAIALASALGAAASLPGCTVRESALRLSSEQLASERADLEIGDLAPPVAVTEWVRLPIGGPVTGFEPGRVYVLEFWTTWCGPCIVIKPRLSAMQDRFAGDGVVVVSIALIDRHSTPARARRIINDAGDRVRYGVALDGGGEMAAAYMRAARENGVPRAFVVDGGGRLAWIGHPADAEEVVAAVAARTWDIDAARERRRLIVRQTAVSRPLVKAMFEARRAEDWEAAAGAAAELAAMDLEAVALVPPYAVHSGLISALSKLGRREEAIAAVERAMTLRGVYEVPEAIAWLATAVREIDMPTADRLATRAEAMLAVRRAAEQSEEGDEWDAFIREANRTDDGRAYDALATVRGDQGRYTEAADLMRMAIERMYGSSDDIVRLAQERWLGYMRKAAAGAGQGQE